MNKASDGFKSCHKSIHNLLKEQTNDKKKKNVIRWFCISAWKNFWCLFQLFKSEMTFCWHNSLSYVLSWDFSLHYLVKFHFKSVIIPLWGHCVWTVVAAGCVSLGGTVEMSSCGPLRERRWVLGWSPLWVDCGKWGLGWRCPNWPPQAASTTQPFEPETADAERPAVSRRSKETQSLELRKKATKLTQKQL